MSPIKTTTNSQSTAPTFHLGLTMAGAVSAGCYSAGVMDYLLEILDLWEKAKSGKTTFDPSLIPTHKVVIDAMGGTSAGGMTTMMSGLYMLGNKINPVTEPLRNPYGRMNILYDSWVHLDDNADSSLLTFEKLWNTTDISGKNKKVQSFLNSDSIDRIADRAFDYYREGTLEQHVRKLPSYVSENLEILLSHTVLRGIPLEVDFSTFTTSEHRDLPTHTSYEHALITHYKLNGGKPTDQHKYFWFNPYNVEEIAKMKLATIATGAYPLGLKFRKFPLGYFSHEYMQNALKRSIFSDFGTEDSDPEKRLVFTNLPKSYETITVDGGAVNNEPYGEVLSIVRKRANNEDYNYGLVMIDPFPDTVAPNQPYSPESDLTDLIPSLFGILRNQSKIKRKEMIDHLSHQYVKGQIYPKRHYYDERGNRTSDERFPIASGSFEAFGGFLDINFRTHDFFLGRNNARNFFRFFFSIPFDEQNRHPIHKDWTTEMISVFGFRNSKDERIYLPIVPDLNLLNAHQLDKELTKSNRAFIANNAFSLSAIDTRTYSIPERPKYNPQILFSLETTIEKRFRCILDSLSQQILQPDSAATEKTDSTISDKWIKDHYAPGLWQHFKKQLFRLFIRTAFAGSKRTITKTLTAKFIQALLKDLDEKKLLKETT